MLVYKNKFTCKRKRLNMITEIILVLINVSKVMLEISEDLPVQCNEYLILDDVSRNTNHGYENYADNSDSWTREVIHFPPDVLFIRQKYQNIRQKYQDIPWMYQQKEHLVFNTNKKCKSKKKEMF